MTPELKQKWLDDLATAKHSRHALYNSDDEGYCCLGRLAAVMGGQLAPGTDAFRDEGFNFYRDGIPMYRPGAFGMLSDEILQEAGLSANMAKVLATLNDRSDSFELVIERIKDESFDGTSI